MGLASEGQPQLSSLFRKSGVASGRAKIIWQKTVPDNPGPKSFASKALGVAAKLAADVAPGGAARPARQRAT